MNRVDALRVGLIGAKRLTNVHFCHTKDTVKLSGALIAGNSGALAGAASASASGRVVRVAEALWCIAQTPISTHTLTLITFQTLFGNGCMKVLSVKRKCQ